MITEFTGTRLGAFLRDCEGGVLAVLLMELWRQGGDAGGGQPLIGPARQIATGGLGERLQQVREGGIAKAVAGKVKAGTGEESVLTNVGGQLFERGCALGVGDAVEVLLDGVNVAGIGGNRVRRRQLILLVGPGLLYVGEGGPGVAVIGNLNLCGGSRPGSEGLVEPEIIPPLHGDQIAEPHVSHLVQDGVVAALVEVMGGLGTKDVLVADGHAAGVFHRTHVVFRAEDLVVLAERVGLAEVLGVEVEAFLGLLEQSVGIEVLGDGLAAVDS